MSVENFYDISIDVIGCKSIVESLDKYFANENNYKGNIKIFGIPDQYVLQGKKSEVLKKLKLDSDSITERIKVITLNTETTVFSFHPHNSK